MGEHQDYIYCLTFIVALTTMFIVSYMLAYLSITFPQDNCVDNEFHLSGTAQEKKAENPNADLEKKETNAPSESKNAKKKKKKDKASKEAKEQADQTNGAESGNAKDETAGIEKADLPSGVDVKAIKKVASMKKKKSSKEMDAAAKAAATEAAARSARLAAAKKKEKNHYNQQPVR